MAMHSSSNILPLFFMLYFLLPIHASSAPSTTVSPETICTYTHFPRFCRSMLPGNGAATVHDYGRHSLEHSLSGTDNFLSLVNGYLKVPDTLSESTVRALEDCQLLASLSKDFLGNTHQTIKFKQTLQSSQSEDLQTYLSATLTNHETCSDGLKAINSDLGITDALSPALSNNSMSYSVSLAIFLHGWGRHTLKGRGLRERKLALLTAQNGLKAQLPLKMKSWYQKTFEFVSRRKLLQAYDNNVKVSQTVVVNPNGSGNFTTISAAVAAAPNNTAVTDGYFLIYINAGVYEENVAIASNKRFIMMVGDGINQTIITGNRSVVDGWTTFNSATFAVTGQGFVAINITFRNTAGAIKHQAVAVRNGADLSTFYSCSFEGYQDTLYAHSLRQFYRECDIYGTVDFIFGNAAVVLQNCNIYPRLPLSNQFNAITAQGRTDINQNTGTSIHNCSIKAASDLASSNGTTQTYLGRPWKEYSRTVYLQSFMDNLINPAGWIAWSGDFALSTLYYAEYSNTGPGSNTTNRVTWPGYHVIGATDAANFTVSPFIQGDYWLPATSVPYAGGLL